MQKDLGATLRQLAEGGAEAFYRGPIARAIARAMEAQHGWITEADLAGYRPTWGTPLAVGFRGHEVCVPPPPTNALQSIQTLHLLEGFDLQGMGHNSVEYLHHFIEAAKIASADRVGLDVLHPDAPIAGLISPRYAAHRRALIDPRQAGVSGGERWSAERLAGEILPGHPADFAKEHTTHFAVADGDGTVVTVTQTLGSPFGSGVMVPGTGMLLNNLLMWADVEPGSPAVLRGGAPMQTRMAPTQVFRDGAFLLSIGTPGSYGILQTTPQMLLNVVEFGMTVQEAIEAPRVRAYRDRLVDVEGRIPESVREGLAARGHQVNVHRGLVVGRRRRPGHPARSGVRRAPGRRRSAPRRLRARDLSGPVAAKLVQKSKSDPEERAMTVAIDDVKRILVVGAGQMGAQIAMQAALHGYAVTLNDLSADILEKAMAGTAATSIAAWPRGR